MMTERTLEQALERARQIVAFRAVNPRYLGSHTDLLDILLLAEEIERLRVLSEKAEDIIKEEWDMTLKEMVDDLDDYDERRGNDTDRGSRL